MTSIFFGRGFMGRWNKWIYAFVGRIDSEIQIETAKKNTICLAIINKNKGICLIALNKTSISQTKSSNSLKKSQLELASGMILRFVTLSLQSLKIKPTPSECIPFS